VAGAAARSLRRHDERELLPLGEAAGRLGDQVAAPVSHDGDAPQPSHHPAERRPEEGVLAEPGDADVEDGG
jgi:hypothetical protein